MQLNVIIINMLANKAQSILQKGIASRVNSARIQQAACRGFAGGAEKPDIDPKITDFDLVVVGKQLSLFFIKFGSLSN